MSVVQPELMDQHLNQQITREALAKYLGVDADKVDTDRRDFDRPEDVFKYRYYDILCRILGEPHDATDSFVEQREVNAWFNYLHYPLSSGFFSTVYRNYIDRFQFYGDRG